MMFAQPKTCRVTDLADVVMINRYYGWYVEPGDLAAAERGPRRSCWSGPTCRESRSS